MFFGGLRRGIFNLALLQLFALQFPSMSVFRWILYLRFWALALLLRCPHVDDLFVFSIHIPYLPFPSLSCDAIAMIVTIVSLTSRPCFVERCVSDSEASRSLGRKVPLASRYACLLGRRCAVRGLQNSRIPCVD